MIGFCGFKLSGASRQLSGVVRWQETVHRVVRPAAWKSGRWVLPVLTDFDAENLMDLRRQIVRFRQATGLEPQVT